MARNAGRATAHNGIATFMKKFSKPFSLDASYIDTEDMSLNYADGLIPMTDIAAAVDAAIGTWQGRVKTAFQMMNLTPRFELVGKDVIYTHPAFNRDTSPNHCLKIEKSWYDQFATTGLGLKMPDKYGNIVLNCDSTHTGANRIRQGLTELPFWLADIPDMGTREDTLKEGLFIAGHMFLNINVINKRGCDVFDQHKIKVACGIYPAHLIDARVRKTAAFVKRSGMKITNAIHNLNEVYETFALDKSSNDPGRLLEIVLKWHVRNFLHQSIDGCLCTSFAMVLQDNELDSITWTEAEMDQVAALLRSRFKKARDAQLAIKEACLQGKNPGETELAPNWVVSNGIKRLVSTNLQLAVGKDKIRNWDSALS